MDSYPYRIVADGVSWPQNMDLMSYCVKEAGGWLRGDPGVWVSPINWDAVYRRFATSGAASSSAGHRAGRPDVRVNRRRLRVAGYLTGSKFTFTTVGPQVGPPLKAGTSTFTLLARGRHGRILHRTSMAAQEIHQDEVAEMRELSAEIPSGGVASVEVLDNGVAVAKRKRPGPRPKVRVIAPRRGVAVGGRRSVAVSWRAVGAGGRNGSASVDFSGDGGHTWQSVYVGPDRGRARIPGSYLAASRRARLRVRVNDGFDEAVATSDIFTSRAAPPLVTIARTPKELPGDTRLQLTGQAFQPGPQALSGKRLRWFDGSVPLGSGSSIMAGPLPPGKNHLRLVAHGPGGASAKAAAIVKVKPVALPFLRLSIPKEVGHRARKVVIRARSAVPATLTVNGTKFKLGGKKKKLAVAVGRRKLSWLRMTVTANGVRTPFAAVVRRGSV